MGSDSMHDASHGDGNHSEPPPGNEQIVNAGGSGDSTSTSDLITIFYQPRATIRRIVESDPTRHVLLLACLGGISETLDRASMRNAGDSVPVEAICMLAVVLGPLGGIFGLYVSGWVLHWSGKLLGGIAAQDEVRAAVAWGTVPMLLGGSLWLPQLILVGREMFTKETPHLNESPLIATVLLVTGGLQIILSLWSAVVLFKCLGEVHRFSAWRALISALLAILLIVVVALVLLVPILIVSMCR